MRVIFLLVILITTAISIKSYSIVGKKLTIPRVGRVPHLHLSVDSSKDVKEQIAEIVSANRVVLFMKGNKEKPLCGFSDTACRVLKSLQTPFETVNVLESPALRSAIKEFSNWPTIPQLYVGGEFVGGSDIMQEMLKSGELAELIEVQQAA